MATYHLHKWAVVNLYDDPYRAPEINPPCLSGYRDQQEKRIRTSPIDKVDGRTITTKSGSVYILEDMDPEYKEWLDNNNVSFDPENPIKVKVRP
jgi:hypothetical protein